MTSHLRNAIRLARVYARQMGKTADYLTPFRADVIGAYNVFGNRLVSKVFRAAFRGKQGTKVLGSLRKLLLRAITLPVSLRGAQRAIERLITAAEREVR